MSENEYTYHIELKDRVVVRTQWEHSQQVEEGKWRHFRASRGDETYAVALAGHLGVSLLLVRGQKVHGRATALTFENAQDPESSWQKVAKGGPWPMSLKVYREWSRANPDLASVRVFEGSNAEGSSAEAILLGHQVDVEVAEIERDSVDEHQEAGVKDPDTPRKAAHTGTDIDYQERLKLVMLSGLKVGLEPVEVFGKVVEGEYRLVIQFNVGKLVG